MLFNQFSDKLQKLEKTASRLEMTALLADLFKQLTEDEVLFVCYLLQGRLVPRHKSLEFNMSGKLATRAIAQHISKIDIDNKIPDKNLFNQQDLSYYQKMIKKIYKKEGDLGLAAEIIYELVARQNKDKKNKNNHSISQVFKLSISQVFKLLTKVARDEGEGSQDRKIVATAKLLSQLNPLSNRYVIRVILGKLRLGFSTMTMLDALSWVKNNDKSDRQKIEAAYNKRADVGMLAQGYLACNSKGEVTQFLADYEVTVNTPVVPALCQRLNSAEEIIEKMGRVLAEPKYDGLRAQIHINKEKKPHYQVFTRNMDDVTHMFPELKTALVNLRCKRCILDSEAIAYDQQTGKLLAFQKTITRKRKYGISDQAETTPIRFYVFDLLVLDGSSLIDLPLFQRKEKLTELVSSNKVLLPTEFIQTSDSEELRRYHSCQLGEGLEGAVIKKVDSKYRGGRKGWRWVKIKEVEGKQGKLSDTLDCVVIGYYRGKGKRAQFGIGAFLTGVISEDGGVKTIAKIGTGLTDDQFVKIKAMADKLASVKKPSQYDVPKELEPDIWIEPGLVVEIAADELTESPLHSAGQAMRFPRLIKIREDKNWDQATTIKELAEIKVS